jgi:HemY protein
VLELRCAAGDWVGALDMLERNHRAGLVDKALYRRQRAVLLTARAQSIEERDPARARPLALEAVKLAPMLVPAAVLAARLLAAAGQYRKASQILDRAWRAHPHPEIAETAAYLRSGDSARERLARVQALAQKVPRDVESALAVAQAAIDALEFATARAALAPHLRLPTQRVALMMAALEEAEHGDEGRVREWTARAVHARRDPAWTADGYVSERWLPVSPVSGRLDVFEWKVPVAELGPPREEALVPADIATPLITAPAVGPEAETVPAAAIHELDDTSNPANTESPPTADATPPRAPQDATMVANPGVPTPAPTSARAASRMPTRRPIEAVDPLVRAPDDPGPEPPPEPAVDRRHLHDLLK